MKKIQLFLITLVFLFQSVSGFVSAEEKQGWEIAYAGDFSNIVPREEYVGRINEDSSYEGIRSFYMNCYALSKVESNYIELKNNLIKTPEAGEYNLKFYVKPGPYGKWTGNIEVTFGGETHIVNCGEGDKNTAPSGEKGWVEKVLNFTYDGESDSALYIRAYDNLFEVYIDSISLTEADTEENLIYDPGFEEYIFTGPEKEDAELYDRSIYMPKKLMISQGSKALGLSWINPSTEELNKISLYDVTEGKETFITDELSTTSSQNIAYKVSGLENGKAYIYKLVFSFDDKGSDEYFLSDTPSTNATISYSNLTFTENRNQNKEGYYCPGKIVIDNTEGYESNSSLKFISNVDIKHPDLASNVYLRFDIRIEAMEAGKKYEISYKYKTKNLKRSFQEHLDWGLFDGATGMYVSDVVVPEWKQRTNTYTSKGKNMLSINLDGLCDGFWIDDIQCYEIDAEGKRVTGENLAINGDFEAEALVRTDSVGNVTAYPKIDSAELSWKNPGANFKGVNIYKKVFDNYEHIGYVSGKLNSVNITGLEKDEEYTYKIVPVNSYGVEGIGEEITFKTLIEDYVVYEPVLKKNGENAEDVSGAGTYTAISKIKNNGLEEGLECEIIVSVIKDKELKGIYSSGKIIPKTDINASASNVYTSFNIPDDDDYTVKIYVINNRQELELFCEPIEY